MWLVFVRWTTADSTKYRTESCSGLDRDLLQEASPTWQTEEKTLLAQILKMRLSFLFSLVLFLLATRVEKNTGTSSAEVQ